MASNESRLLKALQEHHVVCKVVDSDHYRIRGGLAVETDYIVSVKPVSGSTDALFEGFVLSKTYSAFRTLALQLKHAADLCRKHYGRFRSSGGSSLSSGNEASDRLVESSPTAAAVLKVQKYCYLVFQLIDAQSTSYLGKVNYLYVKIRAKQRRQIIDDVFSATCNYFPVETANHAFLAEVATILEAFFLTDHVVSDDPSDEAASLKNHAQETHPPPHHQPHASLDNLNPLSWIGLKGASPLSRAHKPPHLSVDTKSTSATATVVVPISRRSRRSITERDLEDLHLTKVGLDAMLLVDDDRSQHAIVSLPNYSQPLPTVRTSGTVVGKWMDAHPWIFLVIAAIAIAILQRAADSTVTMDSDMLMLCIFASFCLGLHTPRPMVGGFDRPSAMKGMVRNAVDRSGRKLLRRSMVGSTVQNPLSPTAAASDDPSTPKVEHGAGGAHDIDEDDGHVAMTSPMAMFPEDAEIGSHLNCWSKPYAFDFHVRGPLYLNDKKKVASEDFLFPCRGVDLFLTDACPQNVGKLAGVMGGRLRDTPTFIINFVLPWGVLLLYCEIPAKFVPFLEASSSDAAQLDTTLAQMTPSERTTARWLMGDSAYKNQSLKIVPVVVDGPWVVKGVVGGKPALIGAKLPISYVFQPAEGKDAPYLEADLDIAASSAARGILSVARSYTQVLTINLGFVIQGNQADELPEQMLTGACLHGIDPLTAPGLPSMVDDMAHHLSVASSDEDSV